MEPKSFFYAWVALQVILERDTRIHVPILKMQRPKQIDKDMQM